MAKGHRVASGDRLGKTIIFAKNQAYAEFIAHRFDRQYPEYTGHFARVITHGTPYAQSLIDDFSIPDKSPHIAISVDMLDTGTKKVAVYTDFQDGLGEATLVDCLAKRGLAAWSDVFVALAVASSRHQGLARDIFTDYIECVIMAPALKRDFKDRLYAEFARIGKAIANPHRLEILVVLAQGERTVESLATETGLSVANTSRHLQQLRQAQLVLTRREGLFIHYRVAGPEVVGLMVALRNAAEEHLAEIDRVVHDFLGERDGFESVTSDELARLMSNGEIVLLDVRPEQEYAAGHIAGARSMPVSDLDARIGELPYDCKYVAYCRGPYCVYADEAVAVLRANGYTATRLSEGYPEWWLSGRPVQVGPSTDRE